MKKSYETKLHKFNSLKELHDKNIDDIASLCDFLDADEVEEFECINGDHIVRDAWAIDEKLFPINEEATKLYNDGREKKDQFIFYHHCIWLKKGLWEELI